MLSLAFFVHAARQCLEDAIKPKNKDSGADNPGAGLASPRSKNRIDPHFETLDKLYKHLHSHPELSLHEEKTATRMAQEMKDLGFEVTEKALAAISWRRRRP